MKKKIKLSKKKLSGFFIAMIMIFSALISVSACNCGTKQNNVTNSYMRESSVENIDIYTDKQDNLPLMDPNCGWDDNFVNPHITQFDEVNAILEYDEKIIIAGYFDKIGDLDQANNIACYDPDTGEWSAMGSGFLTGYNGVGALAIYNGKLYAGGPFMNDGDYLIARWDDTDWTLLGRCAASEVRSMVVYGGYLYVGGYISSVKQGNDWLGVHHITRYNGGWSKVDGGVVDKLPPTNGGVFDMAVYENKLYVGGLFSYAQKKVGNSYEEVENTYGIARWYSEEWSSVDGGIIEPEGEQVMPNTGIFAFEVYDEGYGPALYVGGNIDYFVHLGDGIDVNNTARYNSSNSWQMIVSGEINQYIGLNDIVTELTVFDDGTGQALYYGGCFRTAGGKSVNHVAKWNGIEWKALGGGIHDEGVVVNAIGVCEDKLCIGGRFIYVGDFIGATPINTYNVAIWQKPCSCPGDFDADGDIDTADLLYLLGAWGTPNGDVDGDGDTDTADLLYLLGHWGPCQFFGDSCQTAFTITPGQPIIADTSCTLRQDFTKLCGDEIENQVGLVYGTHALWFKLEGTGSYLVASLCNENSIPWDGDNHIVMQVFKGLCDDLQCGADGSVCGCEFNNWHFPRVPSNYHNYEWFAEEDVTYWIVIYGFYSDYYGQFELSLDYDDSS